MIELTPFEAARQIRLLSIWLQQANFSIDLPPSANALQQRIGDRLKLAESTGLEPATSAVTGQRSNQLSYDSKSEEGEARTDYKSLQPKNGKAFGISTEGTSNREKVIRRCRWASEFLTWHVQSTSS